MQVHWVLDAAPRSLADVIGYNDDWMCVIQAKALSVLGVANDRSSERSVNSVTKGILKGLKQLTGAMRKIRARVPIIAQLHRPSVLDNALSEFDTVLARELLSALPRHGIERITIVPHRPLHLLPLWAIPELRDYVV
jgi:hypothetical protein